MKTAELTGNALDWAVAKCEGKQVLIDQHKDVSTFDGVFWSYYSPSTDWVLGGHIIDTYKINLLFVEDQWEADVGSEEFATGHTALIAAMRGYVMFKLGDEVEIPDELLNE